MNTPLLPAVVVAAVDTSVDADPTIAAHIVSKYGRSRTGGNAVCTTTAAARIGWVR